MSDKEEQKRITRMNIIYKAIEDGWSVKKSNKDSRTFEFTKTVEKEHKGLLIIGKSTNDVQKQYENINSVIDDKNDKNDKKRSMSTPIIRKN